jgi:hypothetical protein
MEGGHHVQAARFGQGHRVLACRLEILAVLDQLDAQGSHGRVLLHGIAVRHDDGRRKAEAPRAPADRLAMVAARGRDHAAYLRRPSRQPVEVGHAAAHLEGAGRRMVLVLDPHRQAQAIAQQGPGVLRGRRHEAAHAGERLVDVLASELHFGSTSAMRTASAPSTVPIR